MRFNSDVEYQEFRFSSGEGGFSFKWAHSIEDYGVVDSPRYQYKIKTMVTYLSAISY